jgi:lysozyme family protein
MTKNEMLAIYKANYWDAVSGDTLAVGVDLVTWDFGVNSGPARAKKTLLSAIGGDAVQTIQKLSAKRLSFLKGLTTFKTFGKGWSSRVADVEARAVKMAMAGSPTIKSELMIEGLKAEGSSQKKANVTKATGSASAASAAGATGNVDQYLAWGLLGLVAVGIGVAVYFAWKARHDKERAEAYARVAGEA